MRVPRAMRSCLVLLVVATAGGCGGDAAPAPSGTGGKDGKKEEAAAPAPSPAPAGLRSDLAPPTPQPIEAPPATDTAAATPTPAPTPSPGPAPAEVPQRLEDVTDREVLDSWSEDEREALEEMTAEERATFMADRRRELFLARGGVLQEGSGRMEDQAVDAATGLRGPARPDAPPKDLPPADLEAILAALGSKDPETRAAGADLARRYADPAVAARHMMDVLSDPDAEVRAIVVGTLGELKRPEALPALKGLLAKDRNDAVRAAALAAVARIGGPDSIAILREVVRESSEPADRGSALSMLVASGQATHVKDLLDRCFDDLSHDVRRQAALAVRTFGLKEFAPRLEPLLDDYSELVTIEALRAMAELQWKGALGKIVGILVKPDPEADNPEGLQDAAAHALKTITGEDFGYAGTLPEAERLAAIESWRIWWEKQ